MKNKWTTDVELISIPTTSGTGSDDKVSQLLLIEARTKNEPRSCLVVTVYIG